MANYFDRVAKGRTLEALDAAGGPELVSRYAASKKAELASAAERIFSGNFIGEADVKERAQAWVPSIMRFTIGEVPADLEEAVSIDDEAGETVSGEVTDEIAEQAACPLLTGRGRSAGGPSQLGRTAFLASHLARPPSVQIVDDKMLLVTAASVLFQLRMIGRQVGMRMQQHRGIVAGPKPKGKSNTRSGQASVTSKRPPPAIMIVRSLIRARMRGRASAASIEPAP